jgi:hypothetical protein
MLEEIRAGAVKHPPMTLATTSATALRTQRLLNRLIALNKQVHFMEYPAGPR